MLSMNGASGRHGLPGGLAQRGAFVAEDPWIAVLVGPRRSGDPELAQHAGEEAERVLRARILRIGLDELERGLRADALDLELGDERGELAGRVADDRDGALGGKEVEVREVADVVRAEEREPGQAEAANVLQQALAARASSPAGFRLSRSMAAASQAIG